MYVGTYHNVICKKTDKVMKFLKSGPLCSDAMSICLSSYISLCIHRWLYWSDTTNRSIQMVSVTGDRRSTIRTGNPCVNALSVNYWTHTLHWIDTCTFSIESLRLDGDSSTHSSPFASTVFFASALQVYNQKVYYAEGRGVYEADPAGGSEENQLFRSSPTRATGVKVVHPSQQPACRFLTRNRN